MPPDEHCDSAEAAPQAGVAKFPPEMNTNTSTALIEENFSFGVCGGPVKDRVCWLCKL